MGIDKYSDLGSLIMRTAPKDREEEWQRILESYTGDKNNLRDIIVKAKTGNPFEAVSRLRLKEIKTAEEEDGKKRALGTSNPGRIVYNKLYVFGIEGNPSEEIQLGTISLNKLVSAFGTSHQQEMIASKNYEPRIENSISSRLEDYIKNPERLQEIGNSGIRRKILSILNAEADKKLLDIIKSLNREIYSEMLSSMKFNSSYADVDMGLSPMGWLYKHKDDFSNEVKELILQRNDPFCRPEDTSAIDSVLLSIEASSRPFSTKAVLGGFLDDVQYIEKLPDENPVIQKYGRPDLTRVVSVIKQDTITRNDASNVFNSFSMRDFREEYAGLQDARYPEIGKMIAEWEKAIKEGDGVKEDCLGESVPNRLRKEYGFAGLTRDEKKAIMDTIVDTALGIDGSGYKRALPLAMMDERRESLVIASRKARYNIAHGIETQEDLKGSDKGISGNSIDSVDNFEREKGISVLEVIKRYDARLRRRSYIQDRDSIAELAEHGLYDKKSGLEEITAAAKELVPADPDVKRKLKELYDDEMVVNIRCFDESLEYLTKDEADSWSIIVQRYDDIQGLIGDRTDLAEIVARKHEIASRRIIEIEVNRSISAKAGSYEDLTLNCVGVEFINVEEMRNQVDSLTKAEALPEEWYEKLEFIVSFDAKPFLERMEVKGADSNSWKYVQDAVRRKEEYAFSKQTIKSVKETYETIEGMLQYDNNLLVDDQGFSEARISDQFNIHVAGDYNREKFKKEVSRFFNYSGDGMRLYKSFSKATIIDILQKLESFNTKYKTELRAEIV
ncbi:hypothetical protein H6503_00635 [Candidatus Woesearchaeota archaeon]|nr:hypothetical protein [Candidatus Woesearchaeota archaeon]